MTHTSHSVARLWKLGDNIFVDYVEPNKKVNEKRSLAIAETACVTLRSVTAADRLTLNMTM